jgi:IclR helix-turn-helix domain/Transcriptional regulator, AbiEi antitoxin, Type IV TA system
MSPSKQKSILGRLAQRPPRLEGNIELSVELGDEQHGVVRLQHGDIAAELTATGLSVPYPSGLNRLLANDPETELLVVERAPRGLREAAEKLNLSFLDLAGRGRVITPRMVYVATPLPDLGRVGNAPTSPFASKSSRVARVLLSDPARNWRLSDIALLSHLNPGNVHRTLASLVDRGMVERDEDAYVVADPGSLLEAWADQYQLPRDRIWLRIEGELREFVDQVVRRLDGEGVVSGELAAEALAPHLPAESAIVHCLDAERFAQLPPGQAARPLPRFGVSSGEVLVDLADEGYGEFRLERNGLPLASPVQVYIDLAQDRGRGREAAEHLRRQVLRF